LQLAKKTRGPLEARYSIFKRLFAACKIEVPACVVGGLLGNENMFCHKEIPALHEGSSPRVPAVLRHLHLLWAKHL
jgi:hypothetical protein